MAFEDQGGAGNKDFIMKQGKIEWLKKKANMIS